MNRSPVTRNIGKVFALLGSLGVVFSVWSSEHQAPAPQSDPQTSQSRTACVVLTVYDGDTFGCDLNGNGRVDPPTENVRMLGIDTPEMHYSKKNHTGADEPGAKAASDFTTSTLQRQTVYLSFDRQKADRYERTLAYVYLSPEGTTSVNEEVLKKGLGKTLFIPPNMQNLRRFKAAQAHARKEKLGIWAETPSEQLENHLHRGTEEHQPEHPAKGLP